MPSPETPPPTRETIDGIVATTERIGATIIRLRTRLDTLRQTIGHREPRHDPPRPSS